jgi:superfamily II DNA or RNA helicase
MKLRPYQIQAIEAAKQAREDGVRRQLTSMATGLGKTVLFSNLPKAMNFQNRILILAHREELIAQAADKFKRWNPNLSLGIEMAEQHSQPGDQVVVATVQTLSAAIARDSARMKKFDPRDFDAVIADEAHHYTAPSFVRTLQHFGLHDDAKSNTLFYGVTATPDRGDGAGLITVFDRIVYRYDIVDGIRDGYLADMRGLKVVTSVDLDKVHTLGGDFVQDELATAVNNPIRNSQIAKAWVQHAYPRQTIGFTVDIQHAKDLALTFQKNSIPAEAIWGGDPQRKEKLAAHRAGELRALFNAQLLTEGYDDWQVGCIIMAKPTKSALAFAQMAGRGTRIPDGMENLHTAREAGLKIAKEDCLLMDVVDSTSRHSLVTLASLFGMNAAMDLKGKSAYQAYTRMKELEEEFPNVDLQQIVDVDKLDAVQVEAVSLFDFKVPEAIAQHSELKWHQNFDSSFSLYLPKSQRLSIRKDLLGKYTVFGAVENESVHEEGFPLFGDAVTFAELVLSQHGKRFIDTLRAHWKTGTDPVSNPQINLLRRLYSGERNREIMAEIERRYAAGELTKQQASNLADNKIHKKMQVATK